MKTLILFFLINLTSAYGSSTFINKCNEAGEQKTSEDLDVQIRWTKKLFKTESCEKIRQHLTSLKSFSELIPIQTLTGIKPSHAFAPFETSTTKIDFTKNKVEWEKAEKHFKNLELFKEFGNLKHILYENYGLDGRTLCDTFIQAPMINSITVNTLKLSDDDIQCIFEKNIKIFIIGEISTIDVPEKIQNNIYGIDDYVGDIKSLQHLRRLSYLGLDKYSGESNLQELSGIRNLSNLRLNIRNVKTPNALKYLRSLTHLSLSCIEFHKSESGRLFEAGECEKNSLTDISFISDLFFLKSLDISSNKIEDLKPLEVMPNLAYLNARNNKIKELPNSSILSSLVYMDVSKNNIKDISSIRNAQKMKYLNISSNKISKISAISYLDKLEMLILGNNPISDFHELKPSNTLKVLSLNVEPSSSSYNQESSAKRMLEEILPHKSEKPLINQFLTNDFGRHLRDEHQTAIEFKDDIDLAKFKNLEVLSLSGNIFNQEIKFKSLKKLKYLDYSFSEIKISDYLPVTLMYLNIRNTQTKTLKSLANLKSLVVLDIGMNEIEESSELLALARLQYLTADKCKLLKAPPFEYLPDLVYLNLEGNELQTFKNQKSTKIDFLDLGKNKLISIPNFENLPNLIDVYLDFNKINQIQDVKSSINFVLTGNPINKNDDLLCPKKTNNISIYKFCTSN